MSVSEMAITDAGVASGFCTTCLSESADESPRDVRTHNGIGRKFYGASNKCATCHSAVRTLWFVVADFPLIPRGSYRYKNIGTEEHEGFFVQRSSQAFVARRTRTHWNQVGRTWLVGLVALTVITLATLMWT